MQPDECPPAASNIANDSTSVNGSAIRDLLATVDLAYDSGLSVLPPKPNGKKSPITIRVDDKETWKPFQVERPTPGQLTDWYSDPDMTGVGFVTGSVSHGLELFEFDCRVTYLAFKAVAIATGLGPLVERIESRYLEDTPGGGVHWLYYCDEIRPSDKLARRHKTPDEFTDEDRGAIEAARAKGREHRPVKTLIETKGEGGYVVAAPSYGRVHPSGNPYRLIRGGVDRIATISTEERESLWVLAKDFDELAKPDPPRPTRAGGHGKRGGGRGDAIAVWDDYNARTSWPEVLEPLGWTHVYDRGGTSYWRRPGKSIGHSATTNHDGSDRLWNFSSSVEFPAAEKYLSRFDVYALLEHGGDEKAARAALREAGYGAQGKTGDATPAPKSSGNGRAQVGDSAECAVSAAHGSTEDCPTAPENGEKEGWRLDVIGASEIKIEPVRYLSKPFLPRSMLVVLAGLGGEGKSQLMVHVLARGSTGRPVFGQPAADIGAFDSLLLACEDGQKDTLGPRLIAAGADLARVQIVQGLVNQKGDKVPFDISYLPYLRRHIEEGKRTGKDYRIVAIDPITTYVGRARIDDHRDAQLKPALEGLVAIAQDMGVTFLCSAHLNKGGPGKSAIYRIMGGSSYVTTARIVYVLGRDPDDENRRILASPKGNLPLGKPPAIALRLEAFDPVEARRILAPHVGHLVEQDRLELALQLRRIKFDGEVELSADDVLAPGRPKEAPDHIDRATGWLRDRLKDGPAGSVLVAMQGDLELGLPWPKRDMEPERRRVAIAIRVKWWRETVLKPRLQGHSRKHGMGGAWFFVLAEHQWPPSLAAQKAGNEVEAKEATDAKESF